MLCILAMDRTSLTNKTANSTRKSRRDKRSNLGLESLDELRTKSLLNPFPAKISGEYSAKFSAISVQHEQSCI